MKRQLVKETVINKLTLLFYRLESGFDEEYALTFNGEPFEGDPQTHLGKKIAVFNDERLAESAAYDEGGSEGRARLGDGESGSGAKSSTGR